MSNLQRCQHPHQPEVEAGVVVVEAVPEAMVGDGVLQGVLTPTATPTATQTTTPMTRYDRVTFWHQRLLVRLVRSCVDLLRLIRFCRETKTHRRTVMMVKLQLQLQHDRRVVVVEAVLELRQLIEGEL